MADHPTSDERYAAAAEAAPRIPLGPVIDWPKLTPPRPEVSARELYDEAFRRHGADPLFAARVTLARRVLEAVDRQPLTGQHSAWVRAGAALALLVAERPELITGEPPRRRPPVEILTRGLDPLVRVYGLTPNTDGHLEAQRLARLLLQALELDGYEVAVRADRFASLADDGRRVRIPLRGRCGTCRDGVHRDVDGTTDEMLVGPWRHVDPSVEALHEPVLVEAL